MYTVEPISMYLCDAHNKDSVAKNFEGHLKSILIALIFSSKQGLLLVAP